MENIESINDIEELDKLMTKVKEIEKKIATQKKQIEKKKSNRGRLWELAGCKPISLIYLRENGLQYETDCSNPIGAGLLEMCKHIHTRYIGKERQGDGFLEQNCVKISLEEMSEEQMLQSSEMLKKIVEIYNFYFMKNNPTMEIVDRTGTTRKINIIKENK